MTTHTPSAANVPDATPFLLRWQSTAFALVAGGAAVASGRGVAEAVVAAALIAGAAFLDRMRHARDARARGAHAAFLASTDRLGHDVLPVWPRTSRTRASRWRPPSRP